MAVKGIQTKLWRWCGRGTTSLIGRTGDFTKHIFGEHHQVANDWVEKGANGEGIRWRTHERIGWRGSKGVRWFLDGRRQPEG